MDVNVRGMLELTMGVRLGRKVGHAHRWWGRERKGWGGCQRSPSHCTYSPCAESSGVSDEVRAHLGCGSGVSLFLRTLDLNSALLLLPHKKTSHLLNCFFSTDWGDPMFLTGTAKHAKKDSRHLRDVESPFSRKKQQHQNFSYNNSTQVSTILIPCDPHGNRKQPLPSPSLTNGETEAGTAKSFLPPRAHSEMVCQRGPTPRSSIPTGS